MDVARRGVRLARARRRSGSDVAVAFSINGDVDTPDGQETIRLLARAFEADPPDLILLETLSLVRPSTYQTIEALLETGLPLWLSFRRCRHGVCGVYGEHWGGPEGDAFGRAARRFEELGVAALLINCIPPDHATGMLSWLRDFTDLPLGVYPNLGYLSSAGWRHERPVARRRLRRARARLARGGRADHRRLLRRRPRARRRRPVRARGTRGPATGGSRSRAPGQRRGARAGAGPAALERPLRARAASRCRSPRSASRTGVVVPNQASLLVWKHLWRERVGAGRRCLDIGCGSGIQSVQLALNGASSVHALDIDPAAVAQHADQRVPQRRRRARAGRAPPTSTRGSPTGATTSSSRR